MRKCLAVLFTFATAGCLVPDGNSGTLHGTQPPPETGAATPEQTPPTQRLMNIDVEGPATIRVEPLGETCHNAICTFEFVAGDLLTVTAETDGPFGEVVSLGGTCSELPCEIQTARNAAIFAEFADLAHLTLTTSGPATLTVDPSGETCSDAMCELALPLGAEITIDHAHDADVEVVSISGACTAFPCDLTLDDHKTVTSSYRRIVHLALDPYGPGQLEVAPDSLVCRDDLCDFVLESGSTVQITATPDGGADLWSIGGDCAAFPCELTLTSDAAVDTRFVGEGNLEWLRNSNDARVRGTPVVDPISGHVLFVREETGVSVDAVDLDPIDGSRTLTTLATGAAHCRYEPVGVADGWLLDCYLTGDADFGLGTVSPPASGGSIVVRYDDTGTALWQHPYSDSWPIDRDIAPTSDGGAYLLTLGYQGGGYDLSEYALARIDAAGALAWAMDLGASDMYADDRDTAIGVDDTDRVLVLLPFSGTLQVGANSLTTAADESSVVLFRVDPSGADDLFVDLTTYQETTNLSFAGGVLWDGEITVSLSGIFGPHADVIRLDDSGTVLWDAELGGDYDLCNFYGARPRATPAGKLLVSFVFPFATGSVTGVTVDSRSGGIYVLDPTDGSIDASYILDARELPGDDPVKASATIHAAVPLQGGGIFVIGEREDNTDYTLDDLPVTSGRYYYRIHTPQL